MESKTLKQLNKHSQININEEALKERSKDTQRNQKYNDQLSSSQHKKSSHLNSINDAQRDITKKSLLNQENSMSNSKIYQEYLKIYHKSTSLYFIKPSEKRFGLKLIIYSTKRKSEKKIAIDIYSTQIDILACIAGLPNGGLFCYGSPSKSIAKATAVIIDRNFNYHNIPTSGQRCYNSSAIYYNRSVYCFGGHDWIFRSSTTFSNRFDFGLRKWIKLSPLPKAAEQCSTVIFNGNILIANPEKNRLWLYSIDINSFSIIPYAFKSRTTKIMTNTGERLYLFETDDHWAIYESDVGDEYYWKLIKKLEHFGNSHGQVDSCLYNKEKERIYILSVRYPSRQYYKFNLKEKVLRKRRKCIIF